MTWVVLGLVLAGLAVLVLSYGHIHHQQILERKILLLAERMGRIRFVDVVREVEIAPDEAKALLDQMGLKGHLAMQVTPEGHMVYRLADTPIDAPPQPAPLPRQAAPESAPPESTERTREQTH